MSTPQASFLFDAALAEERVPELSPLPAAPPPAYSRQSNAAEFEARVAETIQTLGEDISIEEVLDAMEVPVVSRVGWHRSRVLAVVAAHHSGWQTYPVGPIASKFSDPPTVWRHRRLPELRACPGYEGLECGAPSPNGMLRRKCAAIEAEDLANEEDLHPYPAVTNKEGF